VRTRHSIRLPLIRQVGRFHVALPAFVRLSAFWLIPPCISRQTSNALMNDSVALVPDVSSITARLIFFPDVIKITRAYVPPRSEFRAGFYASRETEEEEEEGGRNSASAMSHIASGLIFVSSPSPSSFSFFPSLSLSLSLAFLVGRAGMNRANHKGTILCSLRFVCGPPEWLPVAFSWWAIPFFSYRSWYCRLSVSLSLVSSFLPALLCIRSKLAGVFFRYLTDLYVQLYNLIPFFDVQAWNGFLYRCSLLGPFVFSSFEEEAEETAPPFNRVFVYPYGAFTQTRAVLSARVSLRFSFFLFNYWLKRVHMRVAICFHWRFYRLTKAASVISFNSICGDKIARAIREWCNEIGLQDQIVTIMGQIKSALTYSDINLMRGISFGFSDAVKSTGGVSSDCQRERERERERGRK